MSRRDEMGYGLQSNMETSNNVVTFSPPVTEGGLNPDREEMSIDETMGTRAPGPQEYGGKIFDGEFELACRPNSVGGLFSMYWGEALSVGADPIWVAGATEVLGTYRTPVDINGVPYVFEVTTAGGSGTTEPAWPTALGATVTSNAVAPAAVYTNRGPVVRQHEWDPLTSDPVFGTVVTKANDPTPAIINRFIGALGNELTLSVEANNYLMANPQMVARQIELDPNPAPSMTREALPKWPFTDVQVLLGIAGAAPTVIKCKEWSLEYNNNLVTDEFILGSALVDSIPLGDIDMNASFRPTRDISAHNRRAMADTPELISLIMRCTGRLIGATTHRYTLDIEIGALETIEAEVALNGGETLRDVEVNCRCILNETTGKLLVPKLKNAYSGVGYRKPV